MADKTAVVHLIDGTEKEVEDWSSFKIQDNFVIFIFNEIGDTRIKTVKSLIFPLSNIMEIEVFTP